MDKGDYVVYQIETALLPTAEVAREIARAWARLGVAEQYQAFDPEQLVVSVPRLVTIWKGDEVEKAWQDELLKVVGSEHEVTIVIEPWSMLPGYPRGEVGVKTEKEV